MVIAELIAKKLQYIEAMCARIPDDLPDLREEVAEFVTYQAAAEWAVEWPGDNVAFLRNVGLPASAPTMLEFRAPAETDSEHVFIGSNNYGDRIVVLKASGNVASINHDCSDRIEYMNRDAISLFKSICAFADLLSGHTGQRGFAETIAAFDPEAILENRWWHREHETWLKNRV
jgi:hypothetical protein